MTIERPWTYEAGSGHVEGQDLIGFTVQATDGVVGQVDRQADGPGMRHLIVDTGVWVFGKSVLIPAGVVTGIDTEERQITLACSKDEVKAAPLFRTDSETLDPDYLAGVDDYYRGLPPRHAE
ncbi:PRC-barrel domain containing protein [Streptomyces sp. NPDC048664]|uniref:PRC-barrel domain containing protein n=1 Tax=Streptomyces sp. NPDC048664 TaxID=3154505 RepID=UPI0034312589